MIEISRLILAQLIFTQVTESQLTKSDRRSSHRIGQVKVVDRIYNSKTLTALIAALLELPYQKFVSLFSLIETSWPKFHRIFTESNWPNVICPIDRKLRPPRPKSVRKRIGARLIQKSSLESGRGWSTKICYLSKQSVGYQLGEPSLWVSPGSVPQTLSGTLEPRYQVNTFVHLLFNLIQ